MMAEKQVYLTEQGFKKLESELDNLRTVKRPELLNQLQEMQSGGDWMDDTEDMLIREELAYMDGRIRELEYMLQTGQLIETEQESGRIHVGSTVLIQQNGGPVEEYTIVGVAEAEPSAGLISHESPLGKALLQHKVGDEVIVTAPAGELHFHVVAVA